MPDVTAPAEPADRLEVVDAVVLAAGTSSRMAPWNKLLLTDASGLPLIVHTVAKLRPSRLRRIHVVLGHQSAQVAAAIAGLDVTTIACPTYAEGLSSSLRAGLLSLKGDAQAVLICLGDMPCLPSTVIDGLVAAWRPGAVVIPTHAGQHGHPRLWDATHIPAMTRLQGDTGAKPLLNTLASQMIFLEVAASGILRDADSPAHLRLLPHGPWHAPDGTPI